MFSLDMRIILSLDLTQASMEGAKPSKLDSLDEGLRWKDLNFNN